MNGPRLYLHAQSATTRLASSSLSDAIARTPESLEEIIGEVDGKQVVLVRAAVRTRNGSPPRPCWQFTPTGLAVFAREQAERRRARAATSG